HPPKCSSRRQDGTRAKSVEALRARGAPTRERRATDPRRSQAIARQREGPRAGGDTPYQPLVQRRIARRYRWSVRASTARSAIQAAALWGEGAPRVRAAGGGARQGG